MSCGNVNVGIDIPFIPPITQQELEFLQRLSDIVINENWTKEAEVLVNRVLDAVAGYWGKLEGRFSLEYCKPDPVTLNIGLSFQRRWKLPDGTWTDWEGGLLPTRKAISGQKLQRRMSVTMGDEKQRWEAGPVITLSNEEVESHNREHEKYVANPEGYGNESLADFGQKGKSGNKSQSANSP